MRIVRLENLQQFTAVNILSDPGAIGGPKIIPSCAQITLNWSLINGKTAHNVWTGRYQGPFGGTVAQANAIMTSLTTGAPWTAFLALITGPAGLTSVTIRDLAVAGAPLISSTLNGIPGTGTGATLPEEMAVCVTLRTAGAGVGNRGRTYLTGFGAASNTTANVIAAATVTAVQNWANTWSSALLASGYTLSIGQPARASYTGSTGTVHPARAAGSVPVTGTVVRDNHWDSQRRRGLK